MAKEKEHLNLAFIGHVDHGKSTLVGHLLLKAGAIAEQQLDDGENKFRFVMDKLGEERERGVTIDLAHQKFSTNKYDYTVVDCPGHRDFVKNMITGASQADAAVLVVAANDGVMPQTKEHMFLSMTLGIKQLIIAVNKMDMENYSEDRFNEVKEEVGVDLEPGKGKVLFTKVRKIIEGKIYNDIMDVWLFDYDGPVDLNNATTDEVAQVAWMDREQIKELFEQKMFVETLEYFFTEVDKERS